MRHTEVDIGSLATEVANSMREYKERDPREALKRVLTHHRIRLRRARDGKYEKGSVAKRVLEEMQKRATFRRKKNRELGIPPKDRESLFPTSLFDQRSN